MNNSTHQVSIIVPIKDESPQIMPFLTQFEMLEDVSFEVIVSDSGCDNAHQKIKAYRAPFPLHYIRAKAGRAAQMNAGAKMANGAIFLFLHADTFLPQNALSRVTQEIGQGHEWGGFYIRFEPAHWFMRCVAWRSNIRIRFFKTIFGDQAMFMTREAFERVRGFPRVPFLEDLDMSKQLGGKSMTYIKDRVVSSSRRFQEGGMFRVYFKMTMVMIMAKLGINRRTIQRFYEKRRRTLC